MKSLHKNWFIENNIDFEYQKYRLLDYISYVEKDFKENKIFPYLPDLIKHRKRIEEYLEIQRKIKDSFPKEIEKIDLENQKIIKRHLFHEDEFMAEINRILEYSIPIFADFIGYGQNIYDTIEESLIFSTIGIESIDKSEGYIILDDWKNFLVYEYTSGKVNDLYFSSIELIKCVEKSILNTPENIKLELIKEKKDDNKFHIILVLMKEKFPIKESIIPILKRKLIFDLTK